MPNHTPGPWEPPIFPKGSDGEALHVSVSAGDGAHPVIAFVNELHGMTDAEQKANALLIAAAPEMLEALVEIAEAMEANCRPGHVNYMSKKRAAEIARAAIAKAEGKVKP
jgi:hypothetical protein